MARTLVGTVVSDASPKTIIVAVQTRKTHALYKKQYTVTKRYPAHDDNNTAKKGDTVEIAECRPLSARKRFILSRVVTKAGVTHTGEADVIEVAEVTQKTSKAKEEDV